MLCISEDGGDVLSISEQADDIDAIAAGEVEPAAREVRDAADTQPIDSAHLAHPRPPGAGHPSDRIQRSHRRIEESFTEVGAALISVVVGSLDETELIASESWILDGDLGPYDVLETRLERADTVVMFDPPTVKCVWRALRRSREQREFWVWLLTWRRRERPRLLAAIERHAPTARFEMVTTDADVERLLSQLS